MQWWWWRFSSFLIKSATPHQTTSSHLSLCWCFMGRFDFLKVVIAVFALYFLSFSQHYKGYKTAEVKNCIRHLLCLFLRWEFDRHVQFLSNWWSFDRFLMTGWHLILQSNLTLSAHNYKLMGLPVQCWHSSHMGHMGRFSGASSGCYFSSSGLSRASVISRLLLRPCGSGLQHSSWKLHDTYRYVHVDTWN